ncbi:HAD family hydrolase [Streptomyces triculaminicus]|uniref:HAD family hydrolase n=2 Tax=Streptomyces TaxID=1883 RepID=A0A939FG88_9ACTN|nr:MULTISPECIES: HAD family hydrolase [Streptomyces]MBO0651275.1 HAD family hydrolase [Streptomyces triculaminicus]QSY49607.1 HAD family hydrolase [Streptomyces griseocarneus]
MTDQTRVGLFDLDDNLVDRAGTYARWAAEFSAEHDVPLGWLLRTDPAYSSRRIAFFELVKTTFDVPGTVAELYTQYRRRMPELIQPDPAVCAGLAALRAAGWRLGVVTNGMTDNQTAKLRQAGLYDLVDAVVISQSVGVRKPDPQIFCHALATLGAKPSPRVVMVGDSLTADVGGALEAGLSALWISHGRPLPQDGPQPHRTAVTFRDAAELLLKES